jgi:predicted acyl esterase
MQDRTDGAGMTPSEMKIEKNVRIPMRDGVHLAADIYRPPTPGKVPALLALSPYGKELQALALTLPPQARPSPLWDGGIEAGDISAVIEHGYAHVIADVRGTADRTASLSATTISAATAKARTSTTWSNGWRSRPGATAMSA